MSKSQLGQTNKYSGVQNSVKNSQQQEEPNISPEQVTQAFKSFNLPMNDRGMNDLGYWTMKKQSDGTKLMEELRKRRTEINSKEDESRKAQEAIHKSKQTLPRLSDNEINSMYDEYGLPSPDPEWARNHLPNDPTKIRSILETHRKMTDDMLKKHAKNAINAIPDVPKMTATSGMAPAMPMNTPSSYSGQGGPNPSMGMPNIHGMSSPMGSGAGRVSPFFVGDNSVVRIVNPNNPNASTLWLIDSKKKILRPFMSEQSFHNAFEDSKAAQDSITTLSSQELGQGGVLDGFKPMTGQYGIKDDGSMDTIDYTPGQIQKRYGQPSNPPAENKALTMIDGILGHLSKTPEQTPQNQALNDNPMGVK